MIQENQFPHMVDENSNIMRVCLRCPLQVNNRDFVVGGLELYDVKITIRIGQRFGTLFVLGILLVGSVRKHTRYNNYGKSQGKPSRASASQRFAFIFKFVMIRLYKDKFVFTIFA